jgi:LmbE family N-acetylglucosaminyl deacetylase
MLGLSLPPGRPLVVVAVGAHCDDIEIGAGATLAALAASSAGLRVIGSVLASTPERAAEARAALPDFAYPAPVELEVHTLPDGRLPEHWLAVKELLHDTRDRTEAYGGADLVLAPSAHDAHQDHRLVGELVPTVFRDQLILSYEILKWDGDLGRPTVYVPLDEDAAQAKSTLLHKHFPSQQGHAWFDEQTFLALMRVRGVECHARYAEAFFAGKVVLDI